MTKIDPASGLDRAAMEFAWKVADRALLEFAPDMGPIVRTAIVTGACTAAIKAYVDAMSRRDALEEPSKMTDADGWIEHDGKGMPVDKGTHVQVRFRNGAEDGPDWSEYWYWGECGGDTITHYRIKEAGPHAVDPVWSTPVGQASAIREIDHFLSDEASGFVNGISKSHLRHWRAAIAAAMMAERSKK